MNPTIQHVHLAKQQGRRAPRVVPAADFNDAFRLTSSNPTVVAACRDIMVNGMGWAKACERHGVSMGGVWKALHRHGLR
ncbi:MAG: hypothetical protein ACK5PF_04600 [bacterium]|jgi:hypothetical protein